jgi:hypothetical protein
MTTRHLDFSLFLTTDILYSRLVGRKNGNIAKSDEGVFSWDDNMPIGLFFIFDN